MNNLKAILRIKNLCFLLFLCLALSETQAQQTPRIEPYKLSWGLDAPLLGSGIGMNLGYFFWERKTIPLTIQEIQALDPMRVNAFDRSTTKNWSRPVAKVSDGALYFSIVSPALLLIDPKIRPDAPKILLMGVQAAALTTGLTNITKLSVKRTRPFNYNPDAPLELKLKKDARYSFFSGHTSTTACMSFFTAKVFHDYNPNSKASPWVWAGAAVFPAAVGVMRWKAGKHFWSDILVGYATGALVGILTPQVHKWINK